MRRHPQSRTGSLLLPALVSVAGLALLCTVLTSPHPVTTVMATLAGFVPAGMNQALHSGIELGPLGTGPTHPDTLLSSFYLLVTVGFLGHIVRDLDPAIPSTTEDLF